MNNVDIIVPQVVTHNLDPHTGIPFLPHMAGYLASSIDKCGYNVNIVDCFGINSKTNFKFKDFLLIGISPKDIISKLSKDSNICFIYCKVIEDLFAVELVIKEIKENYQTKKFVYLKIFRQQILFH